MNQHSEKTVLVTGGNKGIGKEIARQLGAKGWFVILTARSRERGEAAWDELAAEGIQGAFLVLDVGDRASAEDAAEAVRALGRRVDVLINNAGVLDRANADLLTVSPEALEETLGINALGALYVTRAFLSLMGRGGRVIFVSSGAGTYCSGVGAWAPVYSTSKTLMNTIGRHLARELSGEGITVNMMCPGWVKTDMGGSGASRPVEKGAETAVWLTESEKVEGVTGKFWRDKAEIEW